MRFQAREVALVGWSRRCSGRTRLEFPDGAGWEALAALPHRRIPRGAGRSFGDAAFVSGGLTLCSLRLRGIEEVDPRSGTLDCLAGTTVGDILRRLEFPDMQGWTLPVAGGSRWVTVGGAVAADIHGKNHRAQGSFGNHLDRLEVVTASGEVVECSPDRHPDLFAATVGGMGLTGFIRRVRLRLARLPAPAVRWRTLRMPRAAAEAFSLFRTSPGDLETAWIDLTGRTPRGIYHFACYAEPPPPPRRRTVDLPLPLVPLLNRFTLPALHALVYRIHGDLDRRAAPEDFHFPMDFVKHWNRLYGSRGFLQHQFAVCEERAPEALDCLLEVLRRPGVFAYQTVVKRFGSRTPVGLLSFPMAGYSFATDLDPSPEAYRAVRVLTDEVLALGARVYLAKDCCLTPSQFERMEPRLGAWRDVVRRWDPEGKLQSDLSLRLGMKPW